MITNGIINKLNEFFPDNDITDEMTEQGFEEPCFFVERLPSRRRKEVNNSYQNTTDYDIHYFLEEYEEDKNQKYEKIGNNLYQILEYIDLENGRKIRGTGMYWEIVDGVLHFYVTYICYLGLQENADKMKALDVEGSVKDA